MSWSIGLIFNTVELTDECSEALNVYAESQYEDCVYAYDNRLEFDSDAMEHMDFLHDPEVLAILQEHNVSGTVRFASVEGDNSGTMWEHRFINGDYSYKSMDLMDVVIDHEDDK